MSGRASQSEIGSYVEQVVDSWWGLGSIKRTELHATDDPWIESLYRHLDLLAEAVVGKEIPR